MKIEIYPPLSILEIGQRTNQEDSIARLDNRLFVLCDGMGGLENGEVASQTVCQSLTKWFSENYSSDLPYQDGLLKEAIEYAYSELDKYDENSTRKMGTTLTLMLIHRQGIVAAHIGDSRIYHIRPGIGLLYQSRDHSLAFDLYQAGEISYDEMLHYPQKNIVTRAMTPGEDNRMRPDIIHITDILPGDYFYMCSDGMMEQMSNDQLVALLSTTESDENKQRQLVAASIQNQDNHSAWLIHIKAVILEEGDGLRTNEESTARCNALNIKPSVEDATDVDISCDANIDEDEVTMVSSPVRNHQKQLAVPMKYIFAILCGVLVLLGAFLFLKRPSKPVSQPFKPSITPSKELRVSDDSTKKNKKENAVKDYPYQDDTARNKQPVDAPQRYYPSWDLQNR